MLGKNRNITLRVSHVLLWCAVSSAACDSGREKPDRGAQGGASIIGGAEDDGDPSVVGLLTKGQGRMLTCTGAVVAPTVVLTAAHCVSPLVQGPIVGPNPSHEVVLGPDLASVTSPALVREVHFDPMFDKDHPERGHDIAVAILAAPLNLRPLPYNHRPISEGLRGAPVRLVGYGFTDGTTMAGLGIKRQVTTPLIDWDDQLLLVGTSGQQICQGDSGGPAFMTIDGVETIVGVASFTETGCVNGGYHTRVDAFTSFLDAYVGQIDPPAGDDPGASEGTGVRSSAVSDGSTTYEVDCVDSDCTCRKDGEVVGRCTDDAASLSLSLIDGQVTGSCCSF